MKDVHKQKYTHIHIYIKHLYVTAQRPLISLEK